MAVLAMLATTGIVMFALVRLAIWFDSVPAVRRMRIDRQVRRQAGAVISAAEHMVAAPGR